MEIEAKTVSRAPEIEKSKAARLETVAASPVPSSSSVSGSAPTNAREAVDRFLREWFEVEPGAEVPFAEIHAFYMRQALRSKWPPASQVLLSRRLRALGAVRDQRRVSEFEKPIFYVFPGECAVECGPVDMAA